LELYDLPCFKASSSLISYFRTSPKFVSFQTLIVAVVGGVISLLGKVLLDLGKVLLKRKSKTS